MEFSPLLIVVCSAALALAFGYAIWIAVADSKIWSRSGLKTGDLFALSEVASGLRPNGLSDEQAQRLRRRGFARDTVPGMFRVTLRGRLALRLRQTARRRAAKADEVSARSGTGSKY